MKSNEAEVVLLPPEQYVELMDALNDYELLTLAMERLDHTNPAQWIHAQQMDRELAITQEELGNASEVDFE